MLCNLFLIFVSTFFCLENRSILRNVLFDKICSRIHKNELTYKFYTILEWDKYQQFADFIKFLFFLFCIVTDVENICAVFYASDSTFFWSFFQIPQSCKLCSSWSTALKRRPYQKVIMLILNSHGCAPSHLHKLMFMPD